MLRAHESVPIAALAFVSAYNNAAQRGIAWRSVVTGLTAASQGCKLPARAVRKETMRCLHITLVAFQTESPRVSHGWWYAPGPGYHSKQGTQFQPTTSRLCV